MSNPVYGTQGGGIAERIGDNYYFVEAPNACFGLEVGDKVPEQWDIQPANSKATRNEEEEEFGF
jgi:hypothetical protein